MDNQPYGSFLYEMFSRAYTVHPYTWIPIGSMEDLNAAEIDEFRAFYKKFYVPNNACLSIAGDIDVKETKEWIEKYFGSIPRGEDVVQPSIVEPALGGEKRAKVYDNIQLPGLMLGYRIPSYLDPDFYAIDMLGYVLSNGQSSRLNKKLVEEDQSAVQVFAFPFPLEDGGLFVTFAIANAGKQLSDMENPIDAEIARLQTELISDSEYEKIMNQIENDFVSSNGRISGIAESLSDYYLYYGDANLINTEIELYQNVTKEDIMRVAKKYLVNDNRVVLEYLPMSEKPAN